MRSRAMAVVSLVAIVGCSTWQVSTAPVREAAATPLVHTRVTLRDGARMQLWNARVEHDSLVGNLTDDSTRTAFALADVATLELREASTRETIKLALIVALGVAYAFLRVALSDS
jgi:hypothetical protein